jgi:hypothetical protein
MNDEKFDRLLRLLERLKGAKISHRLADYREGAVSVVVRVPGQYWEIDFLDDGEVEVERFVSNGEIDDESALDELFAKFSDEEPAASHDSTAGK